MFINLKLKLQFQTYMCTNNTQSLVMHKSTSFFTNDYKARYPILETEQSTGRLALQGSVLVVLGLMAYRSSTVGNSMLSVWQRWIHARSDIVLVNCNLIKSRCSLH